MHRSDSSTITPIRPHSASHSLCIFLSLFIAISIYIPHTLCIYIYLYLAIHPIYLYLYLYLCLSIYTPYLVFSVWIGRCIAAILRPSHRSFHIALHTFSVNIYIYSYSYIYLYTSHPLYLYLSLSIHIPRLQRLDRPNATKRPFYHHTDPSTEGLTPSICISIYLSIYSYLSISIYLYLSIYYLAIYIHLSIYG